MTNYNISVSYDWIIGYYLLANILIVIRFRLVVKVVNIIVKHFHSSCKTHMRLANVARRKNITVRGHMTLT